MPVIDSSQQLPGAVCAWELDTSCCPGWDAFTIAQQELAASWATGVLDNLTGRRFAQCPVKLRPCGERQGCFFGGYLAWPVNSPASSGSGFPWMIPFVGAGGVWRNCTCAGLCKCRATCEARLPYPVAEVLEVVVDGAVLDPSAYRLDDGNILVLVDGGDCFPQCQDLDLNDTEPNTWSVTVRPGEALPRIGAIAAGRLACEFAKLCAGDADCALPQELVSLSRNGVEVQVMDPQQLTAEGLTQIAEVNLFIKSVNPNQLMNRPRIFSSDIRQPRQVAL